MVNLTILVTGVLCITCFLIGAKVGQAVSQGKEIELPTVNPLKAYREHQDRKEAEREKDKVETILRNVEKYDGTGNGQEDVPRW